MAVKKQADNFPTLLCEDLVLSAADTITFEEINIGLNMFDKVALVLHRIEYEFTIASIALMTANSDWIQLGLVSSQSLTSIGSVDTEVYDNCTFFRADAGTAASGTFHVKPIVHDFSTLPGGGLLIAPKPLYVAGHSNGLANPASGVIRMYFTIMPLSGEDYIELVQTRRAFA